MNKDYLISLLNNTIKTVSVSFGSGKLYTYMTKLDLKKDDFVVVEVSGEYKVVTVVEVHDIPAIEKNSNIKYKWIVSKVNVREYNMQVIEHEELTKKIAIEERKHNRKMAIEALAESMPFIKNIS